MIKIAKGSKWWIISSFFAAIIFLVIYLIFFKQIFSAVVLLVSVLLFLNTVFFLIFFRDPDRKVGLGFVAVADGRIREISKVDDKDIGKSILISTFMNIYDVHVNRAPVRGTVEEIMHISGIHLPAFKKESEKNERVAIIFDTTIGKIKIIQIAGTIARRIVPYIKSGDKINKGDRIGIIRLGSRVDVYVPFKKIKNLNVEVKDRVKAGESIIAEIND